MKKIVLLCVLLAGLTLGYAAHAAVPTVMAFQGKVQSTDGSPLADGAYPLRFAIYDVPTGGVALWSEQNPNVPVAQGQYSVLWGNIVPLPAHLFDGAPRYLGISLGNAAELMPRQQIGAVAYAYHAATADHVTQADNAATATMADHAATADSAASATHALFADATTATNAMHAATASLATTADSAGTAITAGNAAVALYAPAAPQVISVAVRGSHYLGRSNANQTGTVRYRYGVTYACRSLRLVFGNYYRDTSQYAEVPNTNSITFKAALEIAGVTYPLMFQGRRTMTLDSGAQAVSDPLEVPVAAGASVLARVYYDAGAGGYVPVFSYIGYAITPQQGQDGAVYGSDLCDSTGLNGLTTNANFYAWGPTTLLGTPISTQQQPCVAMVGDSIMYGSTDDPANDYWFGFLRRALDTNISYVDLSSGSDTAAQFVSNNFRRAQLLRYATHAICNYGSTDLGNGASLCTLKTNLLSIWGTLHSYGLNVYQCTLLPHAASTDSWVTTTHQSLLPYEATRVALNTWLRDPSSNGAVAQSNGNLSGIFETADVVESGRNSGRWKTGAIFDSGTATSSGSNYLIDSTKKYPAHSLDYNGIIYISGGTGVGQYRQIGANVGDGNGGSGDKINVAPPLDHNTGYHLNLYDLSDIYR